MPQSCEAGVWQSISYGVHCCLLLASIPYMLWAEPRAPKTHRSGLSCRCGVAAVLGTVPHERAGEQAWGSEGLGRGQEMRASPSSAQGALVQLRCASLCKARGAAGVSSRSRPLLSPSCGKAPLPPSAPKLCVLRTRTARRPRSPSPSSLQPTARWCCALRPTRRCGASRKHRLTAASSSLCTKVLLSPCSVPLGWAPCPGPAPG